MWDRPDIDFIQTQDLPWQAVEPGCFGAKGGGLKRLLSSDTSTGAETAIHRLADRQIGTLESAVDLYVLRGHAQLNGDPLLAGDYAYLPAGLAVDLVPSVVGLALYCGFWGPPGLGDTAGEDGPVLRVTPDRQPWVPAEWSGDTPLEPGVMVKRLRQADDALMYMAGMLPGWKCEMEEAHPVYEESFKLHGDILMGPRGVIRAGGYFFRSPEVFHGPLYSREGTISLIRSNGPTTTVYREPSEERRWDQLAVDAYGFERHSSLL